MAADGGELIDAGVESDQESDVDSAQSYNGGGWEDSTSTTTIERCRNGLTAEQKLATLAAIQRRPLLWARPRPETIQHVKQMQREYRKVCEEVYGNDFHNSSAQNKSKMRNSVTKLNNRCWKVCEEFWFNGTCHLRLRHCKFMMIHLIDKPRKLVPEKRPRNKYESFWESLELSKKISGLAEDREKLIKFLSQPVAGSPIPQGPNYLNYRNIPSPTSRFPSKEMDEQFAAQNDNSQNSNNNSHNSNNNSLNSNNDTQNSNNNSHNSNSNSNKKINVIWFISKHK